MKFEYNSKYYDIVIEKKNIKNTYIRVKKDMNIYITTNYLTTNKFLIKLVNDNKSAINKMIDREIKKLENENTFKILGKSYDLVSSNSVKGVKVLDGKIFYSTSNGLDKYVRNMCEVVFTERLDYWNKIIKNIPKYDLVIKKMTRKWGYCNKSKKLVCLNYYLIRYEIDIIDYVIVHELCHFIHFNHSKEFWNLVSSYLPNYKEIRRKLNEN